MAPVEPVSPDAMVNPNGDCANAISAAAWGSVNVASRMKNPDDPLRLARPRRVFNNSQRSLQPNAIAANPMNRITKYAVSLVASISAVTTAAPNR